MSKKDENYIVWYDSGSHKKRRFISSEPKKGEEVKVTKLFGYEQSGALEFTLDIAKMVATRLTLSGYNNIRICKNDSKMPDDPFLTKKDRFEALGLKILPGGLDDVKQEEKGPHGETEDDQA